MEEKLWVFRLMSLSCHVLAPSNSFSLMFPFELFCFSHTTLLSLPFLFSSLHSPGHHKVSTVLPNRNILPNGFLNALGNDVGGGHMSYLPGSHGGACEHRMWPQLLPRVHLSGWERWRQLLSCVPEEIPVQELPAQSPASQPGEQPKTNQPECQGGHTKGAM